MPGPPSYSLARALGTVAPIRPLGTAALGRGRDGDAVPLAAAPSAAAGDRHVAKRFGVLVARTAAATTAAAAAAAAALADALALRKP